MRATWNRFLRAPYSNLVSFDYSSVSDVSGSDVERAEQLIIGKTDRHVSGSERSVGEGEATAPLNGDQVKPNSDRSTNSSTTGWQRFGHALVCSFFSDFSLYLFPLALFDRFFFFLLLLLSFVVSFLPRVFFPTGDPSRLLRFRFFLSASWCSFPLMFFLIVVHARSAQVRTHCERDAL